MQSADLFIIVLLLIIVAIVIKKYILKESFASKEEKAATIVNWFNNNPEPSYQKYIRDVKQSDIVEFREAKELYRAGNLNNNNLISVFI